MDCLRRVSEVTAEIAENAEKLYALRAPRPRRLDVGDLQRAFWQKELAASYQTPTGTRLQVRYQESTGLSLVAPGSPPLPLNQVKGLRFRTPRFSDTVFEFVMDNGRVTALEEREPGGDVSYPKVSAPQ